MTKTHLLYKMQNGLYVKHIFEVNARASLLLSYFKIYYYIFYYQHILNKFKVNKVMTTSFNNHQPSERCHLFILINNPILQNNQIQHLHIQVNKVKPTSGVETPLLLVSAIQFTSHTVIKQSSNEHRFLLNWMKIDKRTYHRVHYRACNDIIILYDKGEGLIFFL